MADDPELVVFWEGLQAYMKEPTYRPFTCAGSPLQYEVMVVGCNPATPMDVPFSAFWSNRDGFDEERFNEAYRRVGGREDGPSRTRTRLKLVTDALPGHIITNLYSKPTRKEDDLKATDKKCTPLWFMIEKVRPKLVFAHGRKTLRAFEARYPAEFKTDECVGVTHAGHKYLLYCRDRFQRLGKGEVLREVGRQLKRELDGHVG